MPTQHVFPPTALLCATVASLRLRMNLPEEKIEKLRELYRKRYGDEITFEQAKEFGEYLIGLFRAVYED